MLHEYFASPAGEEGPLFLHVYAARMRPEVLVGYVLAVVCILLMFLSLLLILPGLPGNWLIIGLAGLWAFFSEPGHFGWQYFGLITGLALLGELAEFLAGHFGAKFYGGSTEGSYGGIVGAIAGGIFGAAFLFGLGALPGALAGGFTGCFIVEKSRGADTRSSLRAAWGATLGRFGGFVVKMSIGIVILWTAVPRIWGSI